MVILDLNTLGLTLIERDRAHYAAHAENLAEAAQIAWEHCLDCTTAANPTPHQKLLADLVDDQGSYEARQWCRNLAHSINVGYAILTETAKDALGCHDWHYVPWFMEHCVDWNDTLMPHPNWVDILRQKDRELN